MKWYFDQKLASAIESLSSRLIRSETSDWSEEDLKDTELVTMFYKNVAKVFLTDVEKFAKEDGYLDVPMIEKKCMIGRKQSTRLLLLAENQSILDRHYAKVCESCGLIGVFDKLNKFEGKAICICGHRNGIEHSMLPEKDYLGHIFLYFKPIRWTECKCGRSVYRKDKGEYCHSCEMDIRYPSLRK